MHIKNEVKDIGNILDGMNTYKEHVTDADISNMYKLLGTTITKGLLPGAKFINGKVEIIHLDEEDK
jgi:hypothetical protein